MPPDIERPTPVRCRYCGDLLDSQPTRLSHHVMGRHQYQFREHQRLLEPLILATFFEDSGAPDGWQDYLTAMLSEYLGSQPAVR
ncbi:MAG TPA: hypothetical protein VIM84_00530 [Gemmatimonadales bacterium]